MKNLKSKIKNLKLQFKIQNFIFYIISILIFSFSIFHFNCFAADQLTVTTYYPSPYGVYKTMRLYPTSRPASCQQGELYYDDGLGANPRGVYYCDNAGAWQAMGGSGGSYWSIVDGSTLTPTNVNWSVSIGSTNPGTNTDGVTKTTGGLIIETRTDDPSGAGLVTGRMWLRTDI